MCETRRLLQNQHQTGRAICVNIGAGVMSGDMVNEMSEKDRRGK